MADGFDFAVSSPIEIGDTLKGVEDTKGAIVGESALLSSSSLAGGAAAGSKIGLEAAELKLSVGLPTDCGEDAGESDMSAEDEIGSRSID